MRKITMLFLFFLAMLFALWLGDAINVSSQIPKTNDEVVDKTIEAVNTADKYFSIGEVITAGGALVTGIIAFTTRNKE